MPVQLINQQTKISFNPDRLKRLVNHCLRHLHLPQAELAILLTGDASIKKLNLQHRGINRPTDILSFGMREYRHPTDPLPPHPEVLGDLAISLETVMRQAQSRRVPVQEELEFIAIHGLLHLLGYDHATLLGKKRMDLCQELLLNTCKTKRGTRG